MATIKDPLNSPQKVALHQLRLRTKIDGLALQDLPIRQFAHLVARPGLYHLDVMMMVLIRSRGYPDEQQLWLAKRFSLWFLLACLDPELKGAERLMFQLFARLIRLHILWPVHFWPVGLAQFKRRLNKIRTFHGKLCQRCGCSHSDALASLNFYFNEVNTSVCAWLVDYRIHASVLEDNLLSYRKSFLREQRGEITYKLPFQEPKFLLVVDALSELLEKRPDPPSIR
jgi:hypothetical protein